jgi:phenylalanyl-tRNA synthetase beta chain
MLFSYNWLQSFFNQKLPQPKKLAELLTLHSFEVEEIKRRADDFALDIDVTPNRVDCFSHWGIARECQAFLGLKAKIKKAKPKESKQAEVKNFIRVEVKNKDACPRYSARVIDNIRVKTSPSWLKKRLRTCGVEPINNIVDATNYLMLQTGQPLHAFDQEKIEGKKIIVRFAKKGERIVTLDNKSYQLDKDILVIADSKRPIAIAGIKGGKDTGIDSKTKTIVLESANFNPHIIRKGARKLKLKTDASFRFEHGLDPNMTEIALDNLASLIQKIAKGRILKGRVDIYPQKPPVKKIRLSLDKVESLLGFKIPKAKIIGILKKLEFKIGFIKQKTLEVEIPFWRQDISLPEDLVEEIGRLYGYKKLPSSLPSSVLVPPKRNQDLFWQNKVSDFLKEMGFFEVYNYSFISKKDAQIWQGKLVELENPISSEFCYLRPTLLLNLLKNIKTNLPYFKEFKIFETGKIFFQKNRPTEKKMLSGMAVGISFYELKGIIDLLLKQLGISSFFYDDFQPTPQDSTSLFWEKARSAEIKIDGREIGFLGEVSKKVLKERKIYQKVLAFDIDFGVLIKEASQESQYQPISKFPAAVRDIAILVPRQTKTAQVLNVINSVGSDLIKDIDLFDIYEGEELPEGKKNFAFHIVYQAKDHTLSSEEIESIHNKIVKALEENLEWEVRR